MESTSLIPAYGDTPTRVIRPFLKRYLGRPILAGFNLFELESVLLEIAKRFQR